MTPLLAEPLCCTVSNCYVSDHLYLSRPSAGRRVRSWRWMISRHGARSPARRAPCRRRIETLGSSTLAMKQTLFGVVDMKTYQIRSLMFLETLRKARHESVFFLIINYQSSSENYQRCLQHEPLCVARLPCEVNFDTIFASSLRERASEPECERG